MIAVFFSGNEVSLAAAALCDPSQEFSILWTGVSIAYGINSHPGYQQGSRGNFSILFADDGSGDIGSGRTLVGTFVAPTKDAGYGALP